MVHKTAKGRQEMARRVLQMLLKVRTRMEGLHLVCPLLPNKLTRVRDLYKNSVSHGGCKRLLGVTSAILLLKTGLTSKLSLVLSA